MTTKGSGMQAIPGFVYDESRGRYFRLPANHFASLPQYQCVLQTPTASHTYPNSEVLPIPHNHPTHSIFRTVRRREHGIPVTQNKFWLTNRSNPQPMRLQGEARMICDSLICNMRKTSSIKLDLRYTVGYQLTDSAINSSGNLLAVTCAKEDEHPVCYKTALALKVVTKIEDGTFKLKQVDTPFGIMKSSSLQTGKGVKIISSGGCNKIVYSDKVVEIAKVDEHCLCLKPLKRVQKDGISTVTLNSVDDHYSLVIGFESGDIQLLQEQSGYQCVQGTRHNDSVLSLALSGQRHLLYAGHRSGHIKVWDLRRQKPVVAMQEHKVKGVPSSVIDIHLLLDDNYFICSAFNSKLNLWDSRLQKAILTYNGHINDYKHCQSLVDSSDSFLISVGSDARIRFWSLLSGELARCIEPLECGLREGSKPLPTICYSEILGGEQFNPTLLVGVSNHIVQFSTHMGQHRNPYNDSK